LRITDDGLRITDDGLRITDDTPVYLNCLEEFRPLLEEG
jgi:hypothetical protein